MTIYHTALDRWTTSQGITHMDLKPLKLLMIVKAALWSFKQAAENS